MTQGHHEPPLRLVRVGQAWVNPRAVETVRGYSGRDPNTQQPEDGAYITFVGGRTTTIAGVHVDEVARLLTEGPGAD